MFAVSLLERSSNGLFFNVYAPRCIKRDSYCDDRIPRAAVLLLHGWLGCRDDMDSVSRFLCERGHLVLAPDLPFHGKSFRVSTATPRDAASLIWTAAAEVLNGLDETAGALILVGYSLGGRIALEIACSVENIHLNLVGAVLISSGYPPEHDSGAVASHHRHAALASKVRSLSTRSAMRTWLIDRWYSSEMWGELKNNPRFPRLVETRLRVFDPDVDFAEHSSEQYNDRLRALADAAENLAPCRMTCPMTWERLANVDVLYVYGWHDKKYAAISSKLKHAYVPHVHTACINEAGHNVLFEKFEESSSLIYRFVSPAGRRTPLNFKPSRVSILKYNLPLVSPFSHQNRLIKERSGLLVAISGADGIVSGVGDVAPLPGLHAETLDECVQQIHLWTVEYLNCDQNDHIQFSSILDRGDCSAGNTFRVHLSSSVGVAVEAALCQCFAKMCGMSVRDFLCASAEVWNKSNQFISINGVVPRLHTSKAEEEENVSTKVAKLLERASGLPVLKLKLGADRSVAHEAHMVKSLGLEFRKQRRLLRLDANRSWTRDEFRVFCNITMPIQNVIEYVEEPLSCECSPNIFDGYMTSYQGVHGQHGVDIPQIALDESLSLLNLQQILQLIKLPKLCAVILKPSVHTDLHSIRAIAQGAKNLSKKVVFTSVFESGVGLAWTTVLAAVFGSPNNIAHGLGTFQMLRGDVTCPRFEDVTLSDDRSTLSIRDACRYLDDACAMVMQCGHTLHPPVEENAVLKPLVSEISSSTHVSLSENEVGKHT